MYYVLHMIYRYILSTLRHKGEVYLTYMYVLRVIYYIQYIDITYIY